MVLDDTRDYSATLGYLPSNKISYIIRQLYMLPCKKNKNYGRPTFVGEAYCNFGLPEIIRVGFFLGGVLWVRKTWS